jgi:SAM-dependent methyltransferase
LPEIHTLFEERRRHWNSILDTVERFKNVDNHLFEVGTGAGYLLQEAAHRGWIPSGIDLSPAAAKYAQGLGLNVQVGDIATVDLPENSFGAILLESTLEHFPSPRRVLEKCTRALQPGGGMFIWTLGSEGDLMTTQGMDFRYVGPAEHLYYFPASALLRLCESVGLRVDTFWRDATFDSVALVAARRIDCWD